MALAQEWRNTRNDFANDVRDLLEANDLMQHADRCINAGFASLKAIAHLDQEALDNLGIPRADQPRMWCAVQAASTAMSRGQSRAASAMANAALVPYGNNTPFTGRSRAQSRQERGPPKQLGPYDLSKAGHRTNLQGPTDGNVRTKEDNMVMVPVGQAFMQPTLKQAADNPAPRLVERPKTYRHATLSARRNWRHSETSLVMPSTEVTRWAAETGFGVPPPSRAKVRMSPQLAPAMSPNLNTIPPNGSSHGARTRSRQTRNPAGNKAMAGTQSSAWWSYAANNAPKSILPHVLHGRRSSMGMV